VDNGSGSPKPQQNKWGQMRISGVKWGQMRLLQSEFLSAGDEYRLKLATVQENSVRVTAVMDNVVVLREINTPPANMAAIFYYHPDHLGTPRVMTGKNQQVVWQADYTPFGDANITTETITNNLRFPGQYYDEETGLHYNYFRDYDPTTGRYIESDPIGVAGGLNTYGYVLQNPLNNYDLYGLQCTGVPDNPFRFKYSPCCQEHDDCYDGLDCRREKSRKECDDEFRECLKDACSKETWIRRRDICMTWARNYYYGVRVAGWYFFNRARSASRNNTNNSQ